MFEKILISNRGEVALRIIRACRELGIKTVAVHSTVDEDSLHVRYADESVCIGPASSTESYLNIPSIISAAEITDADAIHPGYGFLAENAHFAEVCKECQIHFIGPDPQTIRTMGDKAEAKKTMIAAGVPVVPGSDDVVTSIEAALEIAEKIKYPVIIKASAGGGGRGMRIVSNKSEMNDAYLMASNEAQKAFNNPSVYMEKYIVNPKHIEFQILGDMHGNIIHLGERDCSVQRRHQKLIEESPCAIFDPELRKKMGKVAVNAAKAVNYVGAGTIEFLLDADKNYYFMEMNTRIQVEHPVTEVVSDIDIVKEQIRVAAGEPLKEKQSDVVLSGHSIECRINAENPDMNFMPCPGKIITYHQPGGPGVRVDSHVYTDYVISPYYDSMIAKLIVRGHDRQEAIQRMLRALDEYIIEGVKTTIPFHKKVLKNKNFIKGNFGTSFIDEMGEE